MELSLIPVKCSLRWSLLGTYIMACEQKGVFILPHLGPVFQKGVRPGARFIKRRTTRRKTSLVVTLGLSQEKRLNCVS